MASKLFNDLQEEPEKKNKHKILQPFSFTLMTTYGILTNYDATDDPIPQKEKHVVFASRPIVFKSVPWKLDYDSLESQIYNIDNGEYSDFEIGLYFSPSLKLSDANPNLRTPYRPERGPIKFIPILFIILCLAFLFGLIWFIADKLLLVEIEKQVSTANIRTQNNLLTGLANKIFFKKND